MNELKPRRPPGKLGFVLDIVDTKTRKRTVRGLATSDPDEATTIAHDYARFLPRGDLMLHPDVHTIDLLAFHPKAVELALGADHPVLVKLREMTNPKVGLTQEDLVEAEQLARETLESAIPAPRRVAPPAQPGSPGEMFERALGSDSDRALLDEHRQGMDWIAKAIRDNLTRLLPAKLRALNERALALDRENQTLKSRCADMQNELAHLRRRTNVHVTVTLLDAFETYVNSDKFRRLTSKTQKTDYPKSSGK